MSKAYVKFVVEIPDSKDNATAFQDSFDDIISACQEIAETLAE